ncbi:hypothetical protein HYC85_000264 [Camellia sinensis]|uniref:PGG domain-containing protein n=1 Tax=Camellia sinensis TaxID=4442 RepID=A0A7J7I2T0_CAMSI|nr:hypothetical protein HYC85_000264 [Camellia sinensis]
MLVVGLVVVMVLGDGVGDSGRECGGVRWSDGSGGVPLKLAKNADHHSRGDIENPVNCITSGVVEEHPQNKILKTHSYKPNWEKLTDPLKSSDFHLSSRRFERWSVKRGANSLTNSEEKSAFNVLGNLPCIKHVREKKMIHNQAQELIQFLCNEIVKSNYSNAGKIFSLPLVQATSVGIHEIVEAILRSYPDAISLQNQKKQSIFHQAIVYRREKVFNLIRQVESRTIFLSQLDESNNNALHLAGYMAPQQQLYLRAGAALQMQRELHWFKEVEKLVVPRSKEERNDKKMTPAEVFTDTHKDLVKEGERWMKDTANACTILAALIATVLDFEKLCDLIKTRIALWFRASSPSLSYSVGLNRTWKLYGLNFYGEFLICFCFCFAAGWKSSDSSGFALLLEIGNI